MEKQELKQAYERFGVKRDEEGMHGLEKFSFDPVQTAESGYFTGDGRVILFSYEDREPVYGQATIRKETV